MKKYIYSYKNRKLAIYQDAFTTRDEPEKMKELVTRAVQSGAYGPNDHVEELSLYILGTYEDEKGEIEAKQECLLDLDEIYMRSKDNGGNESKN